MRKIRELRQAEISAKVKARREALGLSQKSLAERAGISVHTLLRAEKADAEPSPNALASIACILDVPLDELLYGEPGRFGKPAKLELFELIASFDEHQSEVLLSFAESIRDGLSSHPLNKTKSLDADEGKESSG